MESSFINKVIVFSLIGLAVLWMLSYYSAMFGNKESRNIICAMSSVNDMPAFCLKDLIKELKK